MFGKIIEYQVKQLTYNIYSYYKEQKKNPNTEEYKKDINVIDHVSEVTGLSKSTVTRIVRDGNLLKAKEGKVVFKSEGKKKHVRKKRINVDAFTEAIIRRKVIHFYTVKKEVPSVKKLNMLIREENILKCSNEYLRQLLHKLGFTNAESDSTGMLRERKDIVLERLQYLQAIKSFKEQGKDIFFLNKMRNCMQADETLPKDMPSFVVLYGGGNNGFLDGTSVMIKMKSKVKQEINEDIENFNWIKNSVLRNIASSSVFVINTPYRASPEAVLQDQRPTLASTRASIEDWLRRHNVEFNVTQSKSDLCELINNQLTKVKYSIAKLITEKGHELLYLPENHSDLNPVAVMWDEVKEGKRKTSPKKSFENYPKSKWAKVLEQVKENEDEYYDHDNKVNDNDHIMELKQDTEDEDEQKIKSELSDSEIMDCDVDDEYDYE